MFATCHMTLCSEMFLRRVGLQDKELNILYLSCLRELHSEISGEYSGC